MQTKCQAIDFALGDEKQYAALEDVVRGLDIGVLGECGALDIPKVAAE